MAVWRAPALLMILLVVPAAATQPCFPQTVAVHAWDTDSDRLRTIATFDGFAGPDWGPLDYDEHALAWANAGQDRVWVIDELTSTVRNWTVVGQPRLVSVGEDAVYYVTGPDERPNHTFRMLNRTTGLDTLLHANVSANIVAFGPLVAWESMEGRSPSGRFNVWLATVPMYVVHDKEIGQPSGCRPDLVRAKGFQLLYHCPGLHQYYVYDATTASHQRVNASIPPDHVLGIDEDAIYWMPTGQGHDPQTSAPGIWRLAHDATTASFIERTQGDDSLRPRSLDGGTVILLESEDGHCSRLPLNNGLDIDLPRIPAVAAAFLVVLAALALTRRGPR